MAAQPKRRSSKARRGRRQSQQKVVTKITKHHAVPTYKKGIVDSLLKAIGFNG